MLVLPQYLEELPLSQAILMSMLHGYYTPGVSGQNQLRVWKYRRWWVAKSHQELLSETGLTRRQVDVAVKRLLATGRIKVETMLYNGAPVRHFRCPEMVKLCAGRRPKKPRCYPLDTESKQQVKTPQVQTITESTVEEGNRAKALASKLATGTNGAWLPKPTPIKIEEKTMAKLEAVMAAQKAKKETADQGQNKTMQLCLLWKSLMAETYGGFQKTFTNKEIGQMKLLRLGAGEVSPSVVRYMILKWGRFTWNTKIAKDLKSVPAKPHLGFALAHYEVAVQSIANFTPPSPAVVVLSVHAVQEIQSEKQKDVASEEEVQALWDEFKG